ncbi:CRISPR-associated endonuclease Cas1 [Plantactinospora alkalitolerans]|uniref:hypothetical protein n=1 Tax=Plantactinospora alkalitolerans TaxID=2789879 RepID=UPI001E2837A1|nr:hypothetical protein [Plantactinospora alkalitolerans]
MGDIATVAAARPVLAVTAHPVQRCGAWAVALLRRAAAQRTLTAADFVSDVGSASLSPAGRKKVAVMVREELATTVHHRQLRRKVSYEELLHLEALKLVRLCLEGMPYKPFRPWW